MKGASFIRRNRNGVFFIIITITSLVIMLLSRSSHWSSPSLFSFMQAGLVQFTSAVDDIGLRRDALNTLNDEYQQLLHSIDIYEHALQSSGYEGLNAQQIIDAFSFSSTVEFENVIAQIIARDPNQIFRTFTINKGRRHGIAVDMPVVAVQNGQSGLVGKVVRVSAGSAIVESIIDERSFVVAEHSKSRLVGMMHGAAFGNQVLTLDFMDTREIDLVLPGDIISTSRFSSVYPPNIPIGTIQPFQLQHDRDQATVDVTPILNFNRLNYVFVLLPQDIFTE